jgi:hypothetical protein
MVAKPLSINALHVHASSGAAGWIGVHMEPPWKAVPLPRPAIRASQYSERWSHPEGHDSGMAVRQNL